MVLTLPLLRAVSLRICFPMCFPICLAIGGALLAPPCLAATARQIGGAKLFVSVDDEGVVMYTDIAPADADDAAASVPSARSASPRGKIVPAGRPAVANGSVAGSPEQAGAERTSDRGAELVADWADAFSGENAPLANHRPELRDGGLPPDDH